MIFSFLYFLLLCIVLFDFFLFILFITLYCSFLSTISLSLSLSLSLSISNLSYSKVWWWFYVVKYSLLVSLCYIWFNILINFFKLSVSKLTFVGSKNLATLAHFILSPRPMPRKKECPRTNKESPNCRKVSLRTILFSANRDHRREKQHAIKGRLTEHPKKKDKHSGSAMGAWWRSNSRRNCHLRIKCPQLTF